MIIPRASRAILCDLPVCINSILPRSYSRYHDDDDDDDDDDVLTLGHEISPVVTKGTRCKK